MVQWGQNGSSELEGVRKGQEGSGGVRRGQEGSGGDFRRRVQEESGGAGLCQKGHHKVVYKLRYSRWTFLI